MINLQRKEQDLVLISRPYIKSKKSQSRYDALFSQFFTESTYQSKKVSLNRIFNYLYKYTNVNSINYIQKKTLIKYLKHHKRRDFIEVSFDQVIKDIKNFLFFLENNKHVKRVPTIDLSVGNYELWNSI